MKLKEQDFAVPAASRRRALAQLTIAAGVVYATPTILQLDRSAHAQANSQGCAKGTPNCT